MVDVALTMDIHFVAYKNARYSDVDSLYCGYVSHKDRNALTKITPTT